MFDPDLFCTICFSVYQILEDAICTSHDYVFDTFFHHSSDYLLQAVRVKEVPDLYFPISHSSVEITEHPWSLAFCKSRDLVCTFVNKCIHIGKHVRKLIFICPEQS